MTTATQDAPEVNRPLEDAQATIDVVGDNSPEQSDDGTVVYTEEIPTGDTVPQESIEEQPPEQATEEDWEHKYKVLKGKYDKEVPRLYKEIKQLKKEKEQLLRRLEFLEQFIEMQKMQATVQPQSPQAPQSTDIIEEDEEIKRFKEEYPEVYKMIEKLLKSTVGQIENKVTQTVSSITQQQFEAQLTALVPEWRMLNSDPGFIEWLQVTDPITGLTRHQLLLMAYEKKDATAVANFFKRYLQERNQPFEEETMNDSQMRQQSAPAKRNVAPPHRRVSSSVRESSKKIFKESEIREFYKLCALGKISPEQKAKMEKEITEAIIENRVLLGK